MLLIYFSKMGTFGTVCVTLVTPPPPVTPVVVVVVVLFNQILLHFSFYFQHISYFLQKTSSSPLKHFFFFFQILGSRYNLADPSRTISFCLNISLTGFYMLSNTLLNRWLGSLTTWGKGSQVGGGGGGCIYLPECLTFVFLFVLVFVFLATGGV